MTMANLIDSLRIPIRAGGRRIIGAIRSALEPPIIPVQWKLLTIEQGLARGCKMSLPVPSELTDKILNNNYETFSMRVLEVLISANDVCYDIGGHYGVFTLCMARLAANGQVHVFEPIPFLSDNIEISVRESQLLHVHINRIALADRSGTMAMFAVVDGDGDDSMAYLHEFGGVLTPRSEIQYPSFQRRNVQCLTLDALNAAPPNFIKIDVEGAEFAVIFGGKQILAQFRPRILMEVHGVESGLRCSDILLPLGYQAWQIAPVAMSPQILWVHQSDASARVALGKLVSPAASLLLGSPASIYRDE